jgi:hypothetical protein
MAYLTAQQGRCLTCGNYVLLMSLGLLDGLRVGVKHSFRQVDIMRAVANTIHLIGAILSLCKNLFYRHPQRKGVVMGWLHLSLESRLLTLWYEVALSLQCPEVGSWRPLATAPTSCLCMHYHVTDTP